MSFGMSNSLDCGPAVNFETRGPQHGLLQADRRKLMAASFFKTERSERSRQVIENKGQHFFQALQSRQVKENKGLIFCKAVRLLIT
jgi:hypothetical protein